MYAYEAIVIINYYQDKNLENEKKEMLFEMKKRVVVWFEFKTLNTKCKSYKLPYYL